MVLVRLRGSLGNQLFSYCTGRALALDRKTSLFLDKGPITQHYAQSGYSLHNYPIKATSLPFGTTKLLQLLDKVPLFKIEYFNTINSDVFFDKEIFTNTRASDASIIVLDGTWQSPLYFNSHWDIIKNELLAKHIDEGTNTGILEDISHTNAVSLHVRRGDYLTSTNSAVFANVPLEYYINAIKELEKQVGALKLFVFSDDFEWVSSHIQYPNIRFVSPNIENPQSELSLMSMCKHNIIANSTFSWWGAYLNNNPEKIVIAPKQWYTDTNKNTNTEQYIPQDWLRI